MKWLKSRRGSLILLLSILIILCGVWKINTQANEKDIWPEQVPKPDGDWNYWSNPPHIFYDVHDGNVGIGTTTPQVPLHIEGFEAPGGGYTSLVMDAGTEYTGLGIWKSNGTNWYIWNGYGGDSLSFVTQSPWTTRVVFSSNGRVGIGTNAPDEKLHVEGNVKADGWITGDIIFQKDEKKLWRLFEEEEGLYLEKLSNGQVSKIFLEEDIECLKEEIKKEIIAELKAGE